MPTLLVVDSPIVDQRERRAVGIIGQHSTVRINVSLGASKLVIGKGNTVAIGKALLLQQTVSGIIGVGRQGFRADLQLGHNWRATAINVL